MKFIPSISFNVNILNIPFKTNPTRVLPKTKPIADDFTSNPISDYYSTKIEIEMAAKSNPRIVEIMKTYEIPLQVNTEELEKLKQGHLKDTRIVAAKIYSSLPEDLKKDVDLVNLQQAAMLHDYGKVLIPKTVLNKSGKLNNEEREIMKLHSELGYELLKDKGVSDKTLNLVKYHHQNHKGDGYPQKESDFEQSLELEILNAADKYTALREQRCYKNALGKYEALQIIAKDVNNGNISQEVYTALIRCV